VVGGRNCPLPPFNWTEVDMKKAADHNKTQLDPRTYIERQILHRDILAHHLRWTHIAKFWVKIRGSGNVLDIGCGKGAPLAWALYANKCAPALYVGLEVRTLAKKGDHGTRISADGEKYKDLTALLRAEGKVPDKTFMAIIDDCDVTNFEDLSRATGETGYAFDVIACFEVLEHMPKADGVKLLDNIASAMRLYKDTGVHDPICFLSTPCFNGSAAGNHIYEWRYEELRKALDERFSIEGIFGTFASQTDIKPAFDKAERIVFDRLRGYYDSNYLATIFAPLHPNKSRNCLWRLKVTC